MADGQATLTLGEGKSHAFPVRQGSVGPDVIDIRKLYAETAQVKLGQVAQPLRAALTGRATSPGIFDVLVLLGRDESLARIADRMDGAE